MKIKQFLIAIIIISSSAHAMKSQEDRSESPDFPAAPRSYTISQLVNYLNGENRIDEIMYEDPKAPGSSIINLDNKGLTDLTGLSLLLPNNPKKPVWRITAINNYIATIPADDLAEYKDLEALELDSNCISSLGDNTHPIKFSKICPKCTWITLSNNQITYIYPTSFAQLRALEYLNLSKNNIYIIEDNAFRALLKLKKLYLDNNYLYNLSRLLFQGLRQLEELTLFENCLANPEGIILPSRTKPQLLPQKSELKIKIPKPMVEIMQKMQVAILESKTPSQMVQTMLTLGEDDRTRLYNRAPMHIVQKMQEAQKLALFIKIFENAENPLALKKSIQNCTDQEHDLILEHLSGEAKITFVIILAEVKRGKK